MGVREVLRRIAGKVIVSGRKVYGIKCIVTLQICAGQEASINAAIHSMNMMHKYAVLLVDASNAFNSLKRQSVLHNITYLCPLKVIFAKNFCSRNRNIIKRGVYSR